MMPHDNEAVVQRWWQELWNLGNLAVADEIISPSFTDHDPASPWVPPGIDGCKSWFQLAKMRLNSFRSRSGR
jgi:hypothetical protein